MEHVKFIHFIKQYCSLTFLLFLQCKFYLFNTFSFKNQHTEHGEIPYGFMSNIHPIRKPNKKDTALRSDG